MVAVVLTGVVCYYAGTRRSIFLGVGTLSVGALLVAALLVKTSWSHQDDEDSSTTPSSALASSDNSPESSNLLLEHLPHRHCKRSHSDDKLPSYEEVMKVFLNNRYI